MSARSVLLLVLGLSVVGACSRGDAGQVNRQARRQFHIVMESKLRDLDRGIAGLVSSPATADSAYVTGIEDLKRSQAELQAELKALDSASDQEWLAHRDSVQSHYHANRAQYGALAKYETRPPPLASAITPGGESVDTAAPSDSTQNVGSPSR